MKFEIETKRFAQAVRIVSIVATREAFPNEAAHVLIQAKDNNIIFLATDRVCRIKLTLQDVVVSNPGEITFYVPTLNALCSRLAGKIVAVNTDPSSPETSFSSGEFSCSMNLITFRDLQDIDISRVDTPLAFSSNEISSALSQVCFAAADERSASSLALTDIKINSKSDCLEFVACDAHRLALKKLKCSFEHSTVFDVSLPVRSANKVRMLLKEIPEEKTFIRVQENELVINGKVWIMTCSLSRFPYPLYQKMIPSRKKTTALLDRQAFLGALRRASCLGLMDDTYPRTITLSFHKNRLKLYGNNEVGRGLEYVSARVNGPLMEINLSANHMEEGLGALDCEDVSLLVNGPKDPFLLQPGSQDPNYTYVLMPKV